MHSYVDLPLQMGILPSQYRKDENKWQTYLKEEERRQKIIEEGLMLFAKYYRSLWD